MRSRWATAVVLLASALLWTLCSPAPAADRPATAHPAVQQHGSAEAVPGAVDMPEAVGKPLPGEGDASLHRPLARPPRASGADGAVGPAHPTAGAQRGPAPRPYPVGPPPGRGPVGPAPSVAGLQTFRC
ncbi:hypothetical protein ACFUIT_26565 [Streptomyces sp. NPDC057239]|uniref:hypothetical protein n=1 Tax=Streptomyces sp. NPDC057239 TaxID=3346061 RepID=UPI00363BFC64